MNKSPLFVSLLCMPLAAWCSENASAGKDIAVRPNVIFIIADDLGYGDLGVYGCKDILTPRIDQLAMEGIRLTQGYVSAPYCGPSRAGLMTGRYQQRHGFYGNPSYRPFNDSLGLDIEEETMADVFKRAGYQTAAFGKWHLGAAAPFHPNNRGFDLFYGFLGGGHDYFPMNYPALRKRRLQAGSFPNPEGLSYVTPLEVNGVDLEPQEGYLTDLLTDGALDFIDRNKSRNFFIYLAYNSPHTPLQAPDEYLDMYAHIQDETRGKFAAMVANLDHNVGRIIDQLETLGLKEHTLVVFISDNGGGIRLGANNGMLKGGKAQLWEGGVRVPYIFSWPGYLDRNTVIDTPLSSLDLLPTFAFVAGVTPEGKPLDGKNIIPWLQGDASGRPHELLFWENKQVKGMRYGDYKMVRISEDHPWFLSNLADDVGESKNLAASQANVLKKMESMYWEWYNNLPPVRWPDPDR